MARPREDIIERFNKYIVETPNDSMNSNCLSWVGYINKDGYGVFNHNLDIPNLSVSAHRFTYQVLVKQDLGNLEVDHICKNRTCCNPEHLRLLTKQENLKNRTFKRSYH